MTALFFGHKITMMILTDEEGNNNNADNITKNTTQKLTNSTKLFMPLCLSLL